MKLGTLLHWMLRRFLSGAADSGIHLFVADGIKSFDTVDRGILDRMLSRARAGSNQKPSFNSWYSCFAAHFFQ